MPATAGGGAGVGGGGDETSGCDTITCWFATVTGALRGGPPFASTVSFTDALPDPLAVAIWIQPASVAALHAHAPGDASIATFTAPPPADTATADGDTLKRHCAGSCAMSTFALLTSTVPRRGAGSVFAATRYSSAPLPCPFVPEVMTTHEALVDAAHVQSRVVVTVIVPAAPPAGTDCMEFSALTSHLDADGPVTESDDDPQAAPKSASRAPAARAERKRTGTTAAQRATRLPDAGNPSPPLGYTRSGVFLGENARPQGSVQLRSPTRDGIAVPLSGNVVYSFRTRQNREVYWEHVRCLSEGGMNSLATDESLLSRIRREFLEMPGLRLTHAQARRLWNIDGDTCERLLARLVHTKFLMHHHDGRYGRPPVRPHPALPARMMKAGVDRIRHRRAR
jgi:hypothetical protein